MGTRASSRAVTETSEVGSRSLATSAVATSAPLASAAAWAASRATTSTELRFEPGITWAPSVAPEVSRPSAAIRSRTVRLLVRGT